MNGHFKISLLNSKGLKDEDFIIAKKNNKIFDLINSLESKKNIAHGNMITQILPAWVFYAAMGGLRPPTPYFYEATTAAGLSFICLLSTDSEPSYDVTFSTNYSNLHNVTDSVDTTYGAKRFIEDDISDSDCDLNSTRESLFFRSSFLYLPNEAISSNIKSIGVFWARDADCLPYNYTNWGPFARIRLKDSDGNNTTIVKTADEVLLVEYTLYFTAI